MILSNLLWNQLLIMSGNLKLITCLITLVFGDQFVYSQTVSTNTAPMICKNQGSGEVQLTTLRQVVAQNRRTNIFIILDRSGSVTLPPDLFENTKTFISRLIDSLYQGGSFVIHENYVRFSVVAFGSQTVTEINGIQNSSVITTCNLDVAIDTVAKVTKNDKSYLSLALSGALATLDSREAGRDAANAIWIFSDGEFETGEELNKTFGIINTLKANGVRVFSFAIGSPPAGYMDTLAKELNMVNLATDNDHFTCIETWEIAVHNFTKISSVKTYDDVRPVDVDERNCNNACNTTVQYCGCNVFTAKYACENRDLGIAPTLQNFSATTVTTIKDVEFTRFKIAVTLAALFGILLVISTAVNVVLIRKISLALKKESETGQPENSNSAYCRPQHVIPEQDNAYTSLSNNTRNQ